VRRDHPWARSVTNRPHKPRTPLRDWLHPLERQPLLRPLPLLPPVCQLRPVIVGHWPRMIHVLDVGGAGERAVAARPWLTVPANFGVPEQWSHSPTIRRTIAAHPGAPKFSGVGSCRAAGGLRPGWSSSLSSGECSSSVRCPCVSSTRRGTSPGRRAARPRVRQALEEDTGVTLVDTEFDRQVHRRRRRWRHGRPGRACRQASRGPGIPSAPPAPAETRACQALP
jgi:hypothetical protein